MSLKNPCEFAKHLHRVPLPVFVAEDVSFPLVMGEPKEESHREDVCFLRHA